MCMMITLHFDPPHQRRRSCRDFDTYTVSIYAIDRRQREEVGQNIILKKLCKTSTFLPLFWFENRFISPLVIYYQLAVSNSANHTKDKVCNSRLIGLYQGAAFHIYQYRADFLNSFCMSVDIKLAIEWLKVRSHQRTWTGFGLDLDSIWTRFEST